MIHGMTIEEFDAEAQRNLDSEYRLRVMDTDGPHWLAFNCVSATGCFHSRSTRFCGGGTMSRYRRTRHTTSPRRADRWNAPPVDCI
jgi:hypothetical protein